MKRKNKTITNLILIMDLAVILAATVFFVFAADRNGFFAAKEIEAEGKAAEVTENVADESAKDPEADAISAVSTYVPAKEAAAAPGESVFTVTRYEAPVTMFTNATVNVRAGAGTDYDKVGKLSWGTETTVTGETDNGWYEVLFGEETAYVSGDYVISQTPGTQYLFVGDSRTVQLQMAVGDTDKAYIAKVGEGYKYFNNTVVPSIPQYAGPGTTMIINFGVNDLANVDKYANLVNNNIDAWLEAGIKVYYSSVTPVGEKASVSNAQIESFNERLKSELDTRVIWIDSYSYLTQTGFSSSDGLHYNKETYKNLYAYYQSVTAEQE